MPVLICLREKLWTRTYSIGDQVPTCPVFTRVKIKSRSGILVNLPSQQQQIRDEGVSFILSFIYWVQQPFRGWGSFSWIRWNDWIPQLRCQKYVKSFHVCICPHLVFRASKRVSFLLEVCQSPVRVSLYFICGSCIFQHNADRERAATGWKELTNARSKDVCVLPRHASNGVINPLITAWKQRNASSPLSRGMPFFFYACVISFSC